jgi:DNA-binding CsgD family transcriptional regulator
MVPRARRPEKPTLDAFAENLPGNVYRRVRRPDGTYRFEYLSRGLFRQFDIDDRRLLAQDPVQFDWIHPDDRARFVSDLEISATTLGLLDHRVRVLGADGRVHWARGIARPSRRPDGSVVWDGIVIDVTREVEAESALRLAKDEADRAHAGAARFVAVAVRRLEAPLISLRSTLAALRDEGALDPGTCARLEAVYGHLDAALRDLGLQTSAAIPRRSSDLTARQQQVLTLISAGLSNKAIAQRLGITPGTVKLHVASILRATGAPTRRQLSQRNG